MSENERLTKISLVEGVFETRATKKFEKRKLFEKEGTGLIKAMIPGVIASVDTAVGKEVREGETLMILEAMKMLNRMKAPKDGKVKAIRVAVGEKVVKGQVLIEVE